MFEAFKKFDKRCKALGLVVDFEDLLTPEAEGDEKSRIINQTLRNCINDLEEMVDRGHCTLPPLNKDEAKPF